MKQLVCEMCANTDILKQDGVFVCQSCGIKYSVEEAKKMMTEGTVEVTGTVKEDNSDDVNNYLDMANTALLGGNGNEAFNYANEALEINPKLYKAWTIKMKSIESVGIIGDPRITEVLSNGKNAIEFSPTDKKDEVKKEVYGYYLSQALDLLQVATSEIEDVASIKRIFQSFAAANFWSKSINTLNADSSFVYLMEGLTNNALLLKIAVPVRAIEDNDDFQNLVSSICNQYQNYIDGLEERYEIYGAKLTNEAISGRLKTFRDGLLTESEKWNRRKEEKERKKKEAEKQYFQEHPEIEQAINQKKSIIAPLNNQVDAIKKTISQIEKQIWQEHQKIQQIKRDISDLEETIVKNEKKLFGKEKALQAARYVGNEVVRKKSIIEDSTTLISSLEDDIQGKRKEISKLNDEIMSEQKYIDDVYKEIYQGIE
ncbi:hypothetical protein [Anaerocolumna sp.]|uniref:hypothetical protein n=1 Tax=Anaerocolumna sp. TaxID=2041569 RepID=UPI0028B06502|nr:hypothetical protein [Anaerocolumna sp.]